MKHRIFAYIPIGLILILISYVYLSGIYHDFSFEMLKQEHLKLQNYAHQHPFLASFYFLAIYSVSVAIIVPDAILLTMIGGMLFPLPLAIFYACFSETLGALLFFQATKLAIDNTKPLKKSHILHEIERKLHADEVYYLLFFRLSHLIPFWLINLASALFHVRLRTFIWTTCVGLIPFAYLFSQAGSGLSQYLNTHDHFVIHDLFTMQLKLSLLFTSSLALLPLVIKYFRKKRSKN